MTVIEESAIRFFKLMQIIFKEQGDLTEISVRFQVKANYQNLQLVCYMD